MQYKHLIILLLFSISQIGYGQIFNQQAKLQLSTSDGELTCGESTVSFEEQFIGSETVREITIKNIGNIPLVVYAPQLNDEVNYSFNFNNPEGVIYLAPNAEHIMTVSFHPTAEETFVAYLKFENSDPYNNPCKIRLKGAGVESPPTPFCINFRNIYNPLFDSQNQVVLFDEEIHCGDEIYIDMNDYRDMAQFINVFKFTSKLEEEFEFCTTYYRVGSASNPVTNCEILEAVDENVPNSGISNLIRALQGTPGNIYTFECTFTATTSDGVTTECFVTITVDRSALPPRCLYPYYSIDGGSSWTPTDCGAEIYIDDTENPSTEVFPLQFLVFNNCPDSIEVSGATNYTWLDELDFLPIRDVAPALAAHHTPDDQVLAPGSLYTYKTEFVIENTDTPEACGIIVFVDKRNELDGDQSGSRPSVDGVAIFPTIANEWITLQLDQPTAVQYIIYNQEGQKMKSGTTAEGYTRTSINIRDLANGTYFLKLENQIEALRFIVTAP